VRESGGRRFGLAAGGAVNVIGACVCGSDRHVA
jgi:hypothetical protein